MHLRLAGTVQCQVWSLHQNDNINAQDARRRQSKSRKVQVRNLSDRQGGPMSSLHQVRILARNGECALVSLPQCRLPPAPSIKGYTLLVPSTVYSTSSHFSLKASTKKDPVIARIARPKPRSNSHTEAAKAV